MTYGNIKSLLSAMAPDAFKGLVNVDSGSPTELALYARVTNSEIAANPHKFSWALREYTLTLTGATEYNLKTLIPDLVAIYQIYGDSAPGREAPAQSLREYNRTLGGNIRFSVIGNTLKLTGATSGTLKIPYYSNYLVLDNDGSTRKLNFVDDDDTSVIPEQHVMTLVEGIMRFVDRKKKSGTYTKPFLINGRVVNIDPFQYALRQMVQDDNPIQNVVHDFRFDPAG